MNPLAIVTGGASGIGLALVKQCHAKGMRVIVLDKNAQALDSLKKDLNVETYAVDLSDMNEVSQIAYHILQVQGTPQYLFNNAGIGGPSKLIWEQRLVDLQQVMAVNFQSAFTLTQTFIPAMLELEEQCFIVNTASLASFYTAQMIGPYVISKHAMVAFSECLYHDLKSINANIQVAVVCPGGVKTNILDVNPNEELNRLNQEQQHFLIKFAKLIKKGMSPQTVANIIFAGIDHQLFYIFTHPEMLAVVEQRLQSVLAQKTPQPLTL